MTSDKKLPAVALPNPVPTALPAAATTEPVPNIHTMYGPSATVIVCVTGASLFKKMFVRPGSINMPNAVKRGKFAAYVVYVVTVEPSRYVQLVAFALARVSVHPAGNEVRNDSEDVGGGESTPYSSHSVGHGMRPTSPGRYNISRSPTL